MSAKKNDLIKPYYFSLNIIVPAHKFKSMFVKSQFHSNFEPRMKKAFFTLVAILLIFIFTQNSFAQCSICAKSVQQMGTKPAEGFNHGILYLMMIPYAVIGIVGFKWWKNNR